MKRLFFLIALVFAYCSCFAQSAGQTIPISWTLNLQNPDIIVMPPLDLEGIQQEDYINDQDKSLPWRYGITRPIILDLQSSGSWTDLGNGNRLWRVAIKSPDAINVSVNFNEFLLPAGARLHLYNEDKTEVSKTYSNLDNRDNNNLGSWFVGGDIIWIEYFEPASTTGELLLEIGSLIHGYRMGRINQFFNGSRGINDSGDCNYDVNCSIGSDFDATKDIIKKAVSLLNLGNGYLCSASLVNNTELDKTPYLLTANHCLEDSDPAFWSIRFNWMSPNPICGEDLDSADIQTNFTMSGADKKAANEKSDFALVELYNEIPEAWDVAFAGWDNTDDLPEFEVGIHHPNGDIMKICRDDSGAVRENAAGTEVWLIGGVSVGSGDGWEIGTTESGSSGSPLFDQNGRIIGQLYAGLAFCDGLVNNNDYDIYGRFGVSWNDGDSPDTRLIDWLDPIGTGQSTIESMQNILGVPDNAITGTLAVFPNPASIEITILNTRYPNLVFNFYNTIGQNIMSGSLSNSNNSINVESIPKGIYFLHLIDQDSGADITKKIVVSR